MRYIPVSAVDGAIELNRIFAFAHSAANALVAFKSVAWIMVKYVRNSCFGGTVPCSVWTWTGITTAGNVDENSPALLLEMWDNNLGALKKSLHVDPEKSLILLVCKVRRQLRVLVFPPFVSGYLDDQDPRIVDYNIKSSELFQRSL